MNPLTLIGLVALFFFFAVLWHDESARETSGNQRAAETKRLVKISIRQDTKRSRCDAESLEKVKNA